MKNNQDYHIENSLLNEIQTISESYERVSKATGENFNIFSVLRLETDEVRTHSRFIAELLNPNGSHSQGDVFLQKFIKQCEIEKFETKQANVEVERYIGPISIDKTEGGRIDIIIESTENVSYNKPIMIENKIHAGLQENQLLRYKNAYRSGLLIYLTLFGEDDPVEKDLIFKHISYKNDIINWLVECRKECVNIAVLRELISQYINLIKVLTNQNINNKMNKDIIQRVLKDESTFNAYKKIIKSQNDITKSIFNDVSNSLFEEFKKYDDDNLKLHSDVKEINSSDPQYAGFKFESNDLAELNLRIKFEFQGKNMNQLIFGFNYINSKETNRFDHEKLKKYLLMHSGM